jgi:serine/threonine protein kinase
MDLVELQHYLANLLSALAHIHSLGILHRFTHGLIISKG